MSNSGMFTPTEKTVLLISLAFYAPGPPQAVTAPQPNGEISGRVLDAETYAVTALAFMKNESRRTRASAGKADGIDQKKN